MADNHFNEVERKFNQEDWLSPCLFYLFFSLSLSLSPFPLPTQSADWGRSLFQLNQSNFATVSQLLSKSKIVHFSAADSCHFSVRSTWPSLPQDFSFFSTCTVSINLIIQEFKDRPTTHPLYLSVGMWFLFWSLILLFVKCHYALLKTFDLVLTIQGTFSPDLDLSKWIFTDQSGFLVFLSWQWCFAFQSSFFSVSVV